MALSSRLQVQKVILSMCRRICLLLFKGVIEITHVSKFDQKLAGLFPQCANVMAEMWDSSSIMNILRKLLESGADLHAFFILGRNNKKADLVIIKDSGLLLADKTKKYAYHLGLPQKAMIAKFSGNPLHNFCRVGCEGILDTGNLDKFITVECDGKEIELRVKAVEKSCWLVIYPVGSLLSDQRLENRIKELVLKGRSSSLLSEFMAVDEGRLLKDSSIELIDYIPEDAKLWEHWLSKMDTNMFQTIVHPSNFRTTSGRSDDYYLKMIICNNKKVGTVWLEKINQRNGTAELGLLIGEPQLWGMGLGSKAMKAMIEIAKNDLGIKFLWVSVREANQRAVNCYKKNGFTITGKVPVFNKYDGSYQIWLHMEKMI